MSSSEAALLHVKNHLAFVDLTLTAGYTFLKSRIFCYWENFSFRMFIDEII